MADTHAGWLEPTQPTKYLDSSTTGRDVNGKPIVRERVDDLIAHELLQEISDALTDGDEAALIAKLEELRLQIENEDFSTEATLIDAKDILQIIRDRIGSKGAGVPEEGTTNGLLRQVRDAVQAIDLDMDTLQITADTLNLNTDTLEQLINDLGSAMGTTTDPSSLNTLIGRVKTLVIALEAGGVTNDQLKAIRDAVDAAESARDSDATTAQTRLNLLATEEKQDTANTSLASILSKIIAAPSTEAKQDDLIAQASDFKRLLKFEPVAGEEIRRDETLTDDYHGAAPDGTATSVASWKVCRFYKTLGKIVRVRYRTDVVWDDRTVGW